MDAVQIGVLPLSIYYFYLRKRLQHIAVFPNSRLTQDNHHHFLRIFLLEDINSLLDLLLYHHCLWKCKNHTHKVPTFSLINWPLFDMLYRLLDKRPIHLL